MAKNTGTVLTQRTIDALSFPAGKEHIVWDSDVRGFGVRVSPRGVASYFVQYRNSDRQTRRAVIARTGHMTLKQARIEARVVLSAVAQGRDPSGERKEERKAATVAEMADYFLTVYGVERGLSRKYLKGCAALLTHLIVPRWGPRKVKSITRDDIRRLKLDMRGTPIQTNRCLALLSKMFSLAIEQQLRPDNPCLGIERNVETKRDHYMTGEELMRLVRALNTQEDQLQADGLRLLILTGARIGELLSAQWAHIDFSLALWTKPPSQTKQRRVHRVPLSKPALEILQKMYGSRSPSPFLFPSPIDPATHRDSFNKFWRRVRDEAALPHVRLYDARHTYASFLLVRGVPLGVIGALLGHSQPATTARYAGVADSVALAATEKMGGIFSELDRPTVPEVPGGEA